MGLVVSVFRQETGERRLPLPTTLNHADKASIISAKWAGIRDTIDDHRRRVVTEGRWYYPTGEVSYFLLDTGHRPFRILKAEEFALLTLTSSSRLGYISPAVVHALDAGLKEF